MEFLYLKGIYFIVLCLCASLNRENKTHIIINILELYLMYNCSETGVGNSGQRKHTASTTTTAAYHRANGHSQLTPTIHHNTQTNHHQPQQTLVHQTRTIPNSSSSNNHSRNGSNSNIEINIYQNSRQQETQQSLDLCNKYALID